MTGETRVSWNGKCEEDRLWCSPAGDHTMIINPQSGCGHDMANSRSTSSAFRKSAMLVVRGVKTHLDVVQAPDCSGIPGGS